MPSANNNASAKREPKPARGKKTTKAPTRDKQTAAAAHAATPPGDPARATNNTADHAAVLLQTVGRSPKYGLEASNTNKRVAAALGLTQAHATGEDAITPAQVRAFGPFLRGLTVFEREAMRSRPFTPGSRPSLLQWLHGAFDALAKAAHAELAPGAFLLRPPRSSDRSIATYDSFLEKLGLALEWHGAAVATVATVEKFVLLRRVDPGIQALWPRHGYSGAPEYLKLLHEKAKQLLDNNVVPDGYFLLPAPTKSPEKFIALLEELGVEAEWHGGAHCNDAHVRKFAAELKGKYQRSHRSALYLKLLHEKAKDARNDGAAAAAAAAADSSADPDADAVRVALPRDRRASGAAAIRNSPRAPAAPRGVARRAEPTGRAHIASASAVLAPRRADADAAPLVVHDPAVHRADPIRQARHEHAARSDVAAAEGVVWGHLAKLERRVAAAERALTDGIANRLSRRRFPPRFSRDGCATSYPWQRFLGTVISSKRARRADCRRSVSPQGAPAETHEKRHRAEAEAEAEVEAEAEAPQHPTAPQHQHPAGPQLTPALGAPLPQPTSSLAPAGVCLCALPCALIEAGSWKVVLFDIEGRPLLVSDTSAATPHESWAAFVASPQYASCPLLTPSSGFFAAPELSPPGQPPTCDTPPGQPRLFWKPPSSSEPHREGNIVELCKGIQYEALLRGARETLAAMEASIVAGWRLSAAHQAGLLRVVADAAFGGLRHGEGTATCR